MRLNHRHGAIDDCFLNELRGFGLIKTFDKGSDLAYISVIGMLQVITA